MYAYTMRPNILIYPGFLYKKSYINYLQNLYKKNKL